MEIIYCAGGNQRFAEIAIEAGFKYGAQMPDTVYFPLHFADQDWRKPNRERYMAALAEHRPHIASVMDWESPEQLPEVLDWGEEAARFVDKIMIIPKVIGGIASLPQRIGGKSVRLGYSVPTKFSGTSVPVWEFTDWPVHLLGGSPHKQHKLGYYMNVISADGNMHQKMATQYCAFYDPSKSTKRGYWPTLQQFDGQEWGNDAPYEAFRRSCKNIIEMWNRFRRASDGQLLTTLDEVVRGRGGQKGAK